MVTNPVAKKLILTVGTVLKKGKVPGTKKVKNFLPTDFEKGADKALIPNGKNAFQTFQAASPDQIHQNGLRLIFPMMSQCDPGSSDLCSQGRKEEISFLPSDILQGPFLFPSYSERCDILPFYDAGNPSFLAQSTHQLFLGIRFGAPQTMIQMGYGQGQVILRGKENESLQKCHGIRPS